MFQFLAQSVPIVDQALGPILIQGVMGSLVFFLSLALYREHAALIKCMHDRVDDAKEFGKIVSESTSTQAVHSATMQNVVGLVQNLIATVQNARMTK